MKNVENLPNRLEMLRGEKNISQNQLSKILKISQSRISNWELGACMPSAENLIALAKYFKCSVDYLLGLED